MPVNLKGIKAEFRPADLSMTQEEFDEYLSYLRRNAEARTATDAQREGEVRYYLLGLQIRRYGTGAEQLRAASGASITKGKGDGLSALRAAQEAQRVLAGLPDPRASTGPRSVSVNVLAGF